MTLIHRARTSQTWRPLCGVPPEFTAMTSDNGLVTCKACIETDADLSAQYFGVLARHLMDADLRPRCLVRVGNMTVRTERAALVTCPSCKVVIEESV